MNQTQEDIVKASQSTGFLRSALQEAHANSENDLLSMLLFDLLENASKIETKLKRIERSICS